MCGEGVGCCASAYTHHSSQERPRSLLEHDVQFDIDLQAQFHAVTCRVVDRTVWNRMFVVSYDVAPLGQ
jgi:hypothetical protein